jgi:hypothetical protein
MPIARFEMPDGRIGRFEVAEGTTPEQAQAMIAQQVSGSASPTAGQTGNSAYDRFLENLRNPQTGGRRGVVGPAMVGGIGELTKGAGALTQMAFPEAGSRMVEVGEALTQGAKKVNPVSATIGQIGSYAVPFSAAQKGVNVVKSIPQVQSTIGKIPSFVAATGEQAAIGGALGYGLTPDEQNREQAALFGGAFGGATPTLGKAFDYVTDVIRGRPAPQPIVEAAEKGIQQGYVIPPTQVKPSLLNRVIEGGAGKVSTAQNASFANQQITNRLAAKSLGLPENTTITPELISDIRKTAGQAYEDLGLSGTIKTSSKFNQALDNIAADATKAQKDFPTAGKNEIIELVNSLKSPIFDVSSGVSKIRLLRADADKAYRSGDTALGKANRDASQVLENTIENHLANTKQTDLLDKFREARQTIAKTYTIEKSLNQATGTIDAKKLAAQLQRGKPLSGELKDIAQFSQAFPKATQSTEAMGSIPQTSPLDLYASLGLGTAGLLSGNTEAAAAGLASGLIRPGLRAAALSSPVQSRLTNQQMQNVSPEARNLARMLMLQGATKVGASREKE